MGNFIYPRTVSVARPSGTQNANGLQAVQEFRPANMTSVASGLPASVQMQRNEQTPLVGAPGNAISRGGWRIFIPLGAAWAAGVGVDTAGIQNRDVVTDDLGRSFQVTHAYNNSLGWQIQCERLQS